MSNYTIELGELIRSGFDIGLKNYPLYDEKHREELNRKIINHYFLREIGLETPHLFSLKLNQKMEEIMPYYNQVYKSQDVEFNPLYNIEIIETFEEKGEKTGSSESLGTFADTPSSYVSDYDLKNNKYITNANSGKVKDIDSSRNAYTRRTEGSSAGLPFSKAIKQWREIMLNIDMDIVSELSDLFMNIY